MGIAALFAIPEETMETRLSNFHNENAFTLVELLVVILIIGILAAIAVPVFLNQRHEAIRASMKSDIRNAATVMETSYISNRVYPSVLPTEVKVSDGNAVRLGGSSTTKATTKPLDRIPKTEKTYTHAVVLEDGSKRNIGVYIDFPSDDGKTFSSVSHVVIFNPDRTDGEYLQGFEPDDPMVGKEMRFRIDGSCVTRADGYFNYEFSTITAGTPQVAVSPDDLKVICSSLSNPLTRFDFSVYLKPYSSTWIISSTPYVMTYPSQQGGASKQDYCLDVINTTVSTTYKYLSADRKILEGSCS